MPERRLVLMRHARAEPFGEVPDAQRRLTPAGQAQARAAAIFLRDLGDLSQPCRIVCSPAARTLDTARCLAEGLGLAAPTTDPRIYEATPGDLLGVLADHADARCLVLVGHNPGVEQLVAGLARGQSGAPPGLVPAALAVFQLAPQARIQPGGAHLLAAWSP